MERKEFLKKAGVGTLALGSLPLLADVASADDGEGRRRFYFQALSGTAGLADVIVMSGCGRFHGGDVEGGGEFVHFSGAQLTTPSPAFIATGGWKAVELVSWEEVGTWGRAVAGILTVHARLKPCEGPAIPGATLEIACNLGPAGITTGLAEGYVLTLPDGTTFSPFGAGLTFFTRPCEETEDD